MVITLRNKILVVNFPLCYKKSTNLQFLYTLSFISAVVFPE